MILPSAYFGNIEYFHLLASNKKVIIDHGERFQKQSYRSRCTIVNANGLQDLIVPLTRPNGKETLMKDVRISYADDWIKVHTKSIESAYARTPYYEFYIDGIFEILCKKHEFLTELNKELLLFLVDKTGISCEVKFTQESPAQLEDDPRIDLHPKKGSSFKTYRYIQTFEERHGFQNNLSILDLLFNEGPNSICIIEESVQP